MISMLSEGLQKEVLLTECWIVEMENKGGVGENDNQDMLVMRRISVFYGYQLRVIG